MTTYKLQKDQSGQLSSVVRSDGWSIPFDPANTDYVEYLRWVEAGNTPLPADK